MPSGRLSAGGVRALAERYQESETAAAVELSPVHRDLDLVGIDPVAHSVAALLVLDDVHADPLGLVHRARKAVDHRRGRLEDRLALRLDEGQVALVDEQ